MHIGHSIPVANAGVLDKSKKKGSIKMFFDNQLQKIKDIIAKGAASAITDKQFFELEIAKWLCSEKRRWQIEGELYYNYCHDILKRKRTAIGKNGELTEIKNLPNNKQIDNQYAKMVDQKANYLLARPISFESDNEKYNKALKALFNKQFLRQIKNGGIDALNGGITWLHPYYDESGNFKFKRFPSYEILPFWKDDEHMELDCAVRLYEVEGYEGTTPVVIKKVEIYRTTGVERYVLQGNTLILDNDNLSSDYATIDGKGYNWDRVPLVAFKYNCKEIPLIKKVKGLQDALNIMLSDFMNIMQEDSRNSILIIKNYDGTDLGEFRQNLATYGAVKVKAVDGIVGSVEALQIEVNAGNYEAITKLLKKAIIENAMGYDAKDDRLGGNANQMNIKSMYSDIDLDANNMEAEYQAAFEQLLWFVNAYLATAGKGNFENEPVTVTFNRDMLMNETEIIDNLAKLGVRVSNESLIGQLPFVDDVTKELKKLKEESTANSEGYNNSFVNVNDL